MKKMILGILGLAVMGVIMTSCKKDEMVGEHFGKGVLRAYLERNDDKTYFQFDRQVKWREGDEILLTYGGTASVYAATTVNDEAKYAEFTQVGGETSAEFESGYAEASYPAATCTPSEVKLPYEQTYSADDRMVGFPMYAPNNGTDNDHVLLFQNLCGVLQVTVRKAVTIQQIIVTTDKPISGKFGLTTENGKKVAKSENAMNDANYRNYNSVALDMGNGGVSVSDSASFFIYLPVGTYKYFKITIVTTGAQPYTCTLNKTDADQEISIERNRLIKVAPTADKFKFYKTPNTTNGVSGLFSVAYDKRVYMAPGNLRYVVSSGKWSFYSKQYDRYTNSSQGNNTLSLFTWGYGTWSTSYNTTQNCYDNNNRNFVDWGTELSGTLGSGWCCLTRAEWTYMLGQRTMFWHAPRCARVRLWNGTFGLIIYPDRYPTYKGLPVYTDDFSTQTSTNGFLQVSETNWNTMQANGCIFLPAGGRRYETQLYENNSFGYYYGSGSNDFHMDDVTPQSGGMMFSTNGVSGAFLTVRMGHNVRLVKQDINSPLQN